MVKIDSKELIVLYNELCKAKLEWDLFKKICEYRDTNEEKYKKIYNIGHIMLESLWYSIIMRTAKIWDKNGSKISLLKILNKIKDLPEMQDIRKNITPDVSVMEKNIDSIMRELDSTGCSYNLIVESRHNYFAHLKKFTSAEETQNYYFIGDKRLKKLFEILFEYLEELCRAFECSISNIEFLKEENKLLEEYSYLESLL